MMLLSNPEKLAVKTKSPSHASRGYELEGNLDLIVKLASVVTTIFLNIQRSGIPAPVLDLPLFLFANRLLRLR